MSCDNDCDRTPAFPAAISNRAGLNRIAYRVGDYASFREYMLDRLDAARVLQTWTHRGADDPGIALLECTAVVAEVLAFYQELYGNETFLRSADWRDSISRLIQLTGYRLAPGVGGEAVFALVVDGTKAVTVPSGFGIKVQLEDQDKASIFETQAEHVAYPAQNQFRLYRPRKAAVKVAKGMTELELAAAGNARDLTSRQKVKLKKGDRVMLLPDTAKFDSGGGSYSTSYRQGAAEILVVKETETVLDRISVRFEGELQYPRGTQVKAYVIDRSFRHLGHNAPSRFGGDIDAATGIQDIESTDYWRDIAAYDAGRSDYYSATSPTRMLLDGEIDDLPLGTRLICQGRFRRSSGGGAVGPEKKILQLIGSGAKSAPQPMMMELGGDGYGMQSYGMKSYGSSSYYDKGRIEEIKPWGSVSVDSSLPFTVVRNVESLALDSAVWAGMSGSCSVATLDDPLIANTAVNAETADLRSLVFHEAISPELTLQASTDWQDGAFSANTVHYFGRYQDGRELYGRELMLVHDDGRLHTVKVTNQVGQAELAGRDQTDDWLWPITLSEPPTFLRETLSETEPRVTVHGNLVHTDQGETQPQAILGSGDARTSFQTFAIPKEPLTYLLDESSSPAQVPELMVYVDGLLWQQVDVLFGRAPKERVYVVREDDDGVSYVQFGDGKTGARLPSGRNNVVALYRKGSGARGDADGKPSATGKLKELNKVLMPGPAVGGADPEDEDAAREAAPQRMQSLGRMVGLADYEAEALGLPGVRKARAEWLAPSGSPLIRLTVLTEGGDPAEANKVRQSMTTYNRCRGAARHPIQVRQALRRYLMLDMSVSYTADRREGDIEDAVLAALGVAGADSAAVDVSNGLFGEKARGLGQGVHVSQVLATVQQVSGVSWARVDAFQVLGGASTSGDDPDALSLPPTPLNEEAVGCPGNRLLALYTDHLVLNLIQEKDAEGCQ